MKKFYNLRHRSEIVSTVPIWIMFKQLKLAFSYLLAEKISCSAELSMKKFYNLGPDED